MNATPEPSKVALAFYWILLAMGAAGLSLLVGLCFALDMRPYKDIGAFWWLWPLSCVAALGYGGWRTLVASRRQLHTARPQLYISDLLIVSIVLAIILTAAKEFAPAEFMKYGGLGGSAIAAAMVLALLNASRRGYTGGIERGLYSTGSVLTLFGLGGAGLFLFFCIIVPASEAPRMGLGRALKELWDVLFSIDSKWKHISFFGIGGIIALLVGRALCLLAKNSQQSRETPPDPPIK